MVETRVLVVGVLCVGAVVAATLLTRSEPAVELVPIPLVKVIEVPVRVERPNPTLPPTPLLPEAPNCSLGYDQEGVAIDTWTTSETHLGPFNACEKIDLAYVTRVMPGYQVTENTNRDELMAFGLITVRKHDQTVLIISPATDHSELSILIHDRRFVTPWGVHVGDNLGKLRERQRGMSCSYGATIDTGESMWCHRIPADGWLDTFRYSLDLSPLGPFMKSDRSAFDDERYHDQLHRWHHLRIDAIRWTPATRTTN